MDSLPPSAPSAPCSSCAGEAGAQSARHLRMLEELAEIGMALAREVQRHALSEDASPTPDAHPDKKPDFALVFERLARSVRQTVALEARLAADAASGVLASRQTVQRARSQQRRDVRQLVEKAIAAETDGTEAVNLRYALNERLEDPDFEDELGGQPTGVIVSAICKALGIEMDLSHFTDAELGLDMAAMTHGGMALRPEPNSGRASGSAISAAATRAETAVRLAASLPPAAVAATGDAAAGHGTHLLPPPLAPPR